MWWWRRKEKPLRQLLLEAQAKLRRDIEVLEGREAGTIKFAPDNSALIATLEAEIREIDEALANLGPEDT